MEDPWKNNRNEHFRRAEFISTLIPTDRKYKLLDVGCYIGGLSKFLPKNISYYGVDAVGMNPFKLRIINYDLNKIVLPFRTGEFDIIVCSDVLEHTLHPKEICKELNRVLRPKGLAIISLPNDRNIVTAGRHMIDFVLRKPIPNIDEQKYWHHWIFDIDRAKYLISRYFKIIRIINYSNLASSRFIPKFLLDRFPDFFSQSIFMIARK